MVCKILFSSSERTFKLEQEPKTMHVPFSNARNSSGIELHRRRFFLMPRSRWRESGTASLHAQFGEGKRQFFISVPSLPVCLSCLYPATPSSSIHSCLLNALDFGTSLHPKSSSSAEKPHPRFGSGIRSIHLQELSSGRLSKNFPRGGKRITGCMLS